ncbi:MAG: hypothetical protein KF724_01290 [Phycisphaeraceae bacterium]|nr:hypothetical protein [Phycisphaeraceae bacterium]
MRVFTSFCLTILSTAAVAHGGGATFQIIPGAASANDMSPDGRFIVGAKTGAAGGGAYLLDTVTGVMTTLPPPAYDARAVSDDGTVVLGQMNDGQGNDVAAIWTVASNSWLSLGWLPSGVAGCGSRSSGYDLSADGSVAVGLSWVDGCKARGFKWTAATGMIELGLIGDGNSNRASVINATGSIIAGFARMNTPAFADRVPASWSGVTLTGSTLETPDGGVGGEVQGMNQSGSVLLGNWNNKASKWTNGGATRTTVGAGSIIPGWTGIAMAIAANETTIGFDISFGFRRAWIQLAGQGPLIDLREYLIANGAALPDDAFLEVPRRITTDGSVIIGHGMFTGAWKATLGTTPPGCTGDIAPPGGNGVVDGADLAVVLGAWGTSGADINGDGNTDGADIALILGNWGQCESVAGACCLEGGCALLTASECAAAGGTFLGANVPCTVAGCMNNDFCTSAKDITANINGLPVIGDNTLATPPFGGGDPELPEGTPSCQWSNQPQAVHSTVWYRFTMPSGLPIVSISFCDEQIPLANNDTIIAIYSGTCGSLVQEFCDEDGCGGTSFRSVIQFAYGTPGETYYLMVGNPGSYSGSIAGPFSFFITSP